MPVSSDIFQVHDYKIKQYKQNRIFQNKTLKMALDTSLLNTQQYKVRIKVKVEQSRERSSASLTSGGLLCM